MADRAWILAALADGPRFRTLQVRGRYSVDHEVLRDAIESWHRATERLGGGVSYGFLMATAELAADDGDPERWSAALDRSGPARHRLVTHGHVSVSDGVQVTELGSDMAFVRPVNTGERLAPPLGDLLEPLSLAVRYDIADPVETEHLGRSCAVVTAAVRPVTKPVDAPSSFEFGDRARLVFDVETGTIVRWQSWFHGAELGDLDIVEIIVDEPVSDDAFTAEVPPGIPVRTPEELRAEMETPPAPRSSELPHRHPRRLHASRRASSGLRIRRSRDPGSSRGARRTQR